MKVIPVKYPGSSNYPCYRVNGYNDYEEICLWMYEFKVEHCLMSSDSYGYTFQVRKNLEWFLLRWS